MADNDPYGEHDRHPWNPRYWDLEQSLYTDMLFDEPVEVRLKGHTTALESYVEPSLVNPLSQAAGTRSYILLYPYIVVPQDPHESAIPASELAKDEELNAIFGPSQPDRQELSIGYGAAWYYLEQQTFLLWELLPYERFRAPNPLADRRLQALWHSTVPVLAAQFPDALQVVTPSSEPRYADTVRWQRFLTTQGFQPHPRDGEFFVKGARPANLSARLSSVR
jgi:hypothetical protein